MIVLMIPSTVAIAPPLSAELPMNSPLNTTFSNVSKKLTPPPVGEVLFMKLELNVMLEGLSR